MASGDALAYIHPWSLEAPTANFFTRDLRNGHPVADFDASTDETGYATLRLPGHYSGGGLTVTLSVAATSATSGASRWEVAIERIQAGTLDIDADSFASAKSTGITANGTSGVPTTGTISFTSGAEMDSLAAGEQYRVLIRRDANGTTGTDDMTGDAELVGAWVTET